MKSSEVPGAGVLHKALALVDAVAAANGPVRVSDLVDRTGMPLGTLHRLLSALVQERLLTQDSETKQYAVGARFAELADRSHSHVGVSKLMRSALEHLHAITKESVGVALLEGDHVAFREKIDGIGLLRISLSLGEQTPLHATAAGKVVLAFIDPEQVNRIFRRGELRRYTPATVTDFDTFRTHLLEIRNQGVAFEHEEHVRGVTSMAAPLLGHRGYAVGAIVIAGPSVNLDQDKLESWTAELAAAAQEISIAMGADLPDLQLAVRGGPESANAVTCALRIPAHLGSSPVWDLRCSRLYWIDMLAPSINQFDPASGENRTFYMDDLMGGIALHRDEHLLVAAMRRGIYLFDTRTQELELLAESSETSTEYRFNKGACDLHGRFWTSSMHMGGRPESGKLFRLDPGGRLEVADSGLTLPNALAWSPDWTRLYLTDSAARTIYVYDFDLARGEIENRRPLLRVPPHLGRPTGLTVDREGFLWSTHADGWRVTRYTSDGEVASYVGLPVPTANGCGFGGPKLDKLFITTGRERLSSLRLANAPLAGSIFVHEPGTRGIAPCHFGVKCS